MATKLADAYVQIIPSAKGIQGSISNVLGGEAESAGASAGAGIASKLKGAIAAAGIGTAIVSAVKASIDAGSALQQSFGGLDTIYGDASEKAKEYAYQAAQAGISANDYAEQAVSFGASLKMAFGGDTTKAVEAANTAIMDMTDNAAKMGTPIENIQNAYQGFSKQNYTMLDNLKLGYGGTKAEMERLLKDAQKISGVKYDIENLGDVYDAIHVIQGDLGLTGVAAEEAATTFSGSFGAMKASAENLLANMSLGQDVKAPLKSLLENTKGFLMNNLLPMVRNILTSLPDIFKTAFTWAAEQITSINWIEEGQNLITNIKTGITNLQTDIPQAMDDIGKTAKEWFESVDWNQTGQDIIGLLGDGIEILTEDIPKLIKDIGLKAIEWFNSVDWLQTGSDVIEFIKNGVNTVLDGIPTLIKNIANTAIEWFKAVDWENTGKAVLGLILKGIMFKFITIPFKLLQMGIDAIKAFKGALWEKSGGDVIGYILGGIGKFVLSIPNMLLAIGSTAIQYFKDALWETEAGQVVWDILAGIGRFVLDIPNKLKEIANNAITWFKNSFWAPAGKSIIYKICEGIAELVTSIPQKLKDIAKQAIEWFKERNWKSPGKTVIEKVVNGIKEVVDNIPSKLKEIAKDAIAKFKDGSWLSAGHIVITRIVKGLKEFFSKIPDKLWEIATDATDKFTDIETWKQVGKDIINGIIDGIKSIPDALGNAIKGAVGSAKSTVCGWLGINSPSKMFRDEVGSPIAEGIVNGFDLGIGGLSGDMVSSINEAKKAATDSAKISAGYTISGRSNRIESMPQAIAGAVLDGVKQIADGVERGIGGMKIVANNRETARFVADLGFARM